MSTGAWWVINDDNGDNSIVLPLSPQEKFARLFRVAIEFGVCEHWGTSCRMPFETKSVIIG